MSSGSAAAEVEESQNSHPTAEILSLEHQISLGKENFPEVFYRV